MLSCVGTFLFNFRSTFNINIAPSIPSSLYTNPSLQFELPEAVESADIISAELIYESELKIKNYNFSGKTITVNLEGTQTGYKEDGIEGAILILNVDLKLNRKVQTQESKSPITEPKKKCCIRQDLFCSNNLRYTTR